MGCASGGWAFLILLNLLSKLVALSLKKVECSNAASYVNRERRMVRRERKKDKIKNSGKRSFPCKMPPYIKVTLFSQATHTDTHAAQEKKGAVHRSKMNFCFHFIGYSWYFLSAGFTVRLHFFGTQHEIDTGDCRKNACTFLP